MTGEPFTYTAWDGSEPNDYVGSEDGIRYASRTDSARWNDVDRTSAIEKQMQGFLVEYDVSTRRDARVDQR